jgi:hypothetical protein
MQPDAAAAALKLRSYLSNLKGLTEFIGQKIKIK